MDKNISKNFENLMKTYHHAIEISKGWMPSDYESIVDEEILKINFKPDIFQAQAFYFLAKNESIFVSAHTSSGKTLVAEYAIAKAGLNNNRVIYTSPIKALSNQKFYDFKQKYEDVGLITGDVQVNPDAKCLIMTTEILRNFVYKNADILRDTEYVIFDEVHYINDQERGVVWEECIIMMPDHISLVMLSATIPNSLEFSEWVGRAKNRTIKVISTLKRAVPLEFCVYCDSEAYKLDGLPPSCTQDDNIVSNFKEALQPFSKKVKIYNPFKINDLGNFIKLKNLLPAIFFAFSRKSCEEHGRALQNLDLTSDKEKICIEDFLNNAMTNLKDSEKHLPQIKVMRAQVYRGIGVHHGTLLPFVKECVEILFSENLIKILIATETFAMGVNMPAKCCVFLNLSKIDNGTFRSLTTGEFIQMSGRAGRRGKDKVGTVIVADTKIISSSIIRKVIGGSQNNMISRFRLSFSLILMASRSNVEVEELMRSSFRENSSQKFYDSDMIRLEGLRKENTLSCEKCVEYMSFFNELASININMSTVLRSIAKIGTICILKNNSIVRIVSISTDGFKCTNYDFEIEGNLFKKDVTNDLLEMETNFNITKGAFRFPLQYRNRCEGRASFEDVMFTVKDKKISFEFDQMPFQLVTVISNIKSSYEKIIKSTFLSCEKGDEHYYEAIHSKSIIDEIRRIEYKYSTESLNHIAEFHNRLAFLKHYKFYEDKITTKGRAAAELRTVNEVLAIELIFNNEFESFNSSEIMAVFSTMISEISIENYIIEDSLQMKMVSIKKYHDSMNKICEKFSIKDLAPLNFSCAQAVYDWCQGEPLEAIIFKHNIPEGSFVRLILRLDECCREILNVTSVISNEDLECKINMAVTAMRRDIIFLPSLYI